MEVPGVNDDHGEPELVMPFLPVRPVGGPYDDDAFVAGYQMGLLDAQLGGSTFEQGQAIDSTFEQGQAIDSACKEQADLIAMRHGFVAEFHPPKMCAEHADEASNWTCMTVRPARDKIYYDYRLPPHQ